MTAQEHFEKGQEHYNKSEYEDAILHYTNAVNIDPAFTEAFYNRGLAEYELHHYKAATISFSAALRLDNQWAGAYIHRGASLYELERYDEAIKDMNHAIQLKPDNATAFNGRGSSYYKLHQYHAAIKDLDTAIELDPELSQAYNNRGTIKQRSRDFEGAIADYTMAIELDSEFASAYSGRGSAKGKLLRHKEAIIDYDHAIQLKPNDAEAYCSRGAAYFHLGHLDKSMNDFNYSLQLEPDYSLAWYGKGTVYLSENNIASAKACFIRSVNLQQQQLENVFRFFDQHPTAPFLIMRLMQGITPSAVYGKGANLITTTFTQSAPLYAFITHESLQRDHSYSPEIWKKWLGILNYYMGDPIVAYSILSELLDMGLEDPMINAYLILCCYDFAEDASPHITKAVVLAERIKKAAITNQISATTEGRVLDLYYAGLIFVLAGQTPKALECFSGIQKNFLPAAYLALEILVQDGSETDLAVLKEHILQREEQLGHRGFAHGLKEHYIDFEQDRLDRPFAYYFRYFEIAPAIELFIDLVEEDAPFDIERPSWQPAFYELFKIKDHKLEDIRRREEIRHLLDLWEQQLNAQKKAAYESPVIPTGGRSLKTTLRELQEAASSDELETILGEHIEEFLLSTEQYQELLDYFFLKQEMSAYQKLLFDFYVLDQAMKLREPSKSGLAGLKDGVKKIVGEGLTNLSMIIAGGTLSGLSVPVALSISIGVAIARGALGELFIESYKNATSDEPLPYLAFKNSFESYVAAKRAELGPKFEEVYPIAELYK